MAKDKRELADTRFAVRAVKDHIAMFGKPPKVCAYDHGGGSQPNVAELKKLGVAEVRLAPRGRANWEVHGKMKDKPVSERAQVEAGIETTKSSKYGFTRPAAKSERAMGMCGQRVVLGFNLNKLVRGLADPKRNGARGIAEARKPGGADTWAAASTAGPGPAVGKV